MSDEQARTDDQAEQENLSREQQAQQMPDELKVDVDQEKLAAWDEARSDYGLSEEPNRPIMAGEGQDSQSASEQGEADQAGPAQGEADGANEEQQEQAEREAAEAAERRAASE